MLKISAEGEKAVESDKIAKEGKRVEVSKSTDEKTAEEEKSTEENDATEKAQLATSGKGIATLEAPALQTEGTADISIMIEIKKDEPTEVLQTADMGKKSSQLRPALQVEIR